MLQAGFSWVQLFFPDAPLMGTLEEYYEWYRACEENGKVQPEVAAFVDAMERKTDDALKEPDLQKKEIDSDAQKAALNQWAELCALNNAFKAGICKKEAILRARELLDEMDHDAVFRSVFNNKVLPLLKQRQVNEHIEEVDDIFAKYFSSYRRLYHAIAEAKESEEEKEKKMQVLGCLLDTLSEAEILEVFEGLKLFLEQWKKYSKGIANSEKFYKQGTKEYNKLVAPLRERFLKNGAKALQFFALKLKADGTILEKVQKLRVYRGSQSLEQVKELHKEVMANKGNLLRYLLKKAKEEEDVAAEKMQKRKEEEELTRRIEEMEKEKERNQERLRAEKHRQQVENLKAKPALKNAFKKARNPRPCTVDDLREYCAKQTKAKPAVVESSVKFEQDDQSEDDQSEDEYVDDLMEVKSDTWSSGAGL